MSVATETKITERPILFAADMVRAIRAGRKTQTRRPVRWKPYHNDTRYNFNFSGTDLGYYCTGVPTSGYVLRSRGGGGCWNDRTKPAHCPYGQVGDLLWVREAYTRDHAAFYPNFPIVYRADGGLDYERNEKGEVYSPEQKAWYPYRWHPAIHMPRSACRIILEITATRIERLCRISDADAKAEGMNCRSDLAWGHGGVGDDMPAFAVANGHRFAFKEAWEKIYTKPDTRWEDNPWVWVVEFKPIPH